MNITRGYLRFNRSSPERLMYFITNKCNSRCKHCFYWRELNKKDDELNIEEIRKIAKSLGKLYELFLSGGEPFLREDIDKICEIFYKECKVKHIHIPTNGLLQERILQKVEKILSNCKDLRLVIGISLEGLEKSNDYIRGVKGHFKKAVSLALKLKEIKKKNENLDVYFISTVSNKNIKEIFPLASYIKNKTGLSLDIAPIRGSPKSNHLLAPAYEDYKKLLLKLYTLKKRREEKNIIKYLGHKKSRYIDKIILDVIKSNKLPFQCLAGSKITVLEPNGEIRLCELTGKIGNIRDYGYNLRKLLKNDKARKMKEKIKDCYCTHGCFISTSLKYSPKELLKCFFTKT